ncbi:rRNA-processing protein UTP23-like protein [Frankliniella fusca]|uniref:rRNA-processing protein UTP23 homolog n=1 Tax=Frankliniella fusca TaxID=407009 RepID=A0AAE1H325_9NEOP|nr:rRNA-processing protein UTP23-like protein [Frankliniella fusca]
MRINRHKRIQKTLAFYSNNFGFRKPFQVLIDGTFCFVALKDKLDIQDQLKKYLGDDIKLLTTPCIVLETEKLGKSVFGAMLIIKKFPIHKCSHKDKPVTGSECLKSMIGTSNPNRYIIATQDRDLQNILRSIPAVPLLYFYNKAPTLEAPTDESYTAASQAAKNLWGVSEFEQVTLAKLKEVELGIKPGGEPAPKKRKKKKGPNPLSCKKSKKKKIDSIQPETKNDGRVKKKRCRKNKRIPQHVKEELLHMKSA